MSCMRWHSSLTSGRGSDRGRTKRPGMSPVTETDSRCVPIRQHLYTISKLYPSPAQHPQRPYAPNVTGDRRRYSVIIAGVETENTLTMFPRRTAATTSWRILRLAGSRLSIKHRTWSAAHTSSSGHFTFQECLCKVRRGDSDMRCGS